MTGITLDSFVEGGMTLRGQASALDVQKVIYLTQYLFDHVQKSDHECTHRLRELSLHVGNIAKHLTQQSDSGAVVEAPAKRTRVSDNTFELPPLLPRANPRPFSTQIASKDAAGRTWGRF